MAQQRTYHAIYDGVRTLAKECQRGYYAVQLGGGWVLKSQTDPNLVLLGDKDMAAEQRAADGPLWMKACLGGNKG